MARRRRHQARPKARAAARDWQWLRSVGYAGLVGGFVAGLLWSARWLADPVHLPVRRVEIAGAQRRVSTDAVRRATASAIERGLLWVDLDEVREAVEALPWVDRVSVRRRWPDVLAVAIVEQQATARWRAGGLLNIRGERFIPATLPQPAGLPELAGPDGQEGRVLARWLRVDTVLRGAGLRAYRLEMDPRRAWRLWLANGPIVDLGRQQLDARLARLTESYPQALGEGAARARRLDMRYANGFAVQWRPDDGEKTLSDKG